MPWFSATAAPLCDIIKYTFGLGRRFPAHWSSNPRNLWAGRSILCVIIRYLVAGAPRELVSRKIQAWLEAGRLRLHLPTSMPKPIMFSQLAPYKKPQTTGFGEIPGWGTQGGAGRRHGQRGRGSFTLLPLRTLPCMSLHLASSRVVSFIISWSVKHFPEL